MPNFEASNPDTYALTPEQLQQVMGTLDIPACPTIVKQAMAESQKDEPDLTKLASLITHDPAMTAAVLKLVNSPIYRASKAISSVREAVERLGSRSVVTVVVAVALRAMITGLSSEWLEQFWKRTTQVAVASAMIARKQFGVSPDVAYTYALFHDAAIPMLMKRFSDYEAVITRSQTEGVLLHDAEKGHFPCSHPVVGSLLIRNWGLPAILGLGIRYHHEPDVYELSDKVLPGGALSFIAITHIAEHLAAEHFGELDTEVGMAHFEKALDYLGASEQELDEFRERVSAALEADA
jgi:HD-like signal output (HDOD) protein